MKEIFHRVSIRKYEDRPVEKEAIMRSLFLVVSNVCANGIFTSPFVQVPVIMRNPIRFL